MYEQAPKGEYRTPRHTHYVSIANGIVHPAMQNLPGYEDDNLADWRPATADEIERYKEGRESTLAAAVGTVDLRQMVAPVQATVTSLKLAEEDPLPPETTDAQQDAAAALAAQAAAIPVPPAAPVDNDPPQLPPGALSNIPPPAFRAE